MVNATTLRLALAACPYPGGFADRTPHPSSFTRPAFEFAFSARPGPADAARQQLLAWVAEAGPEVPAIQVWTGDNIYIDATAGLFDPALAVTGGGPGTRMQAAAAQAGAPAGIMTPGTRAQARALPNALVRAYAAAHGNLFVGPPGTRLRAVDDHEIVDNWEPSQNPPRRHADYRRLNAGRRAFVVALRNDQLGMNPSEDAPVPLWQQRSERGLRFFVCDTRTERRVRRLPDLEAPIMSGTQFGDLLACLEPGPGEEAGFYRRVIVSPAILLPRRLATSEQRPAAWRSDAWDGFPASFHALLAALAEKPRLRALFLSGDEHMPCLVRARVQRADRSLQAAELLSVHAGAMYAPYPFANSRPEDFSDEPKFIFRSGGRRYICRIEQVRYVEGPGDGFVGIEFNAGGEPWRIDWHRADGRIHPLGP